MTAATTPLLAQAASQAAAQSAAQTTGLTPAGTAVMTLSITLVLALTIFCFWRILREPAPETHHHAPLEIETDDLDE